MEKQIQNVGMSLSNGIRTMLVWAVLSLFAGVVSGCGGGGGGGGGVVVGGGAGGGVDTPLLDSFGNVVTEIGSSSVSNRDAGGDGVVTDGIPVANASVVVTDINGNTATATTDAAGYYRIKLTGFTAPLVFRAINPINNVTRSSLSTDIVTPGKFINTNISGLTDKIASDVAVAGGQLSPFKLTPQIIKTNSAIIPASISNLANQFTAIITKAGLNPASFNPLNVPFRADNTGYNNVLYNTIVINSYAATTAELLIAPDYVSPGSVVPVALLPGNWTYSISDPGRQSTVTESGFYVPTSLNALVNATFNAWLQPSSTVSNSKVSLTGRTASFTQTIKPTQGGMIISNTVIKYISYNGCGSCGVGSTIAATWSWSQTNNGEDSGESLSTAVYTRIN